MLVDEYPEGSCEEGLFKRSVLWGFFWGGGSKLLYYHSRVWAEERANRLLRFDDLGYPRRAARSVPILHLSVCPLDTYLGALAGCPGLRGACSSSVRTDWLACAAAPRPNEVQMS
jgi:hypothetical protein